MVEITAIVSLAGVIFSLIFLGYQTRELARQTRLNNKVGLLSGMYDALTLLQTAQLKVFEDPKLSAYFYEGAQLPPRGDERVRVQALAEIWVDGIECTLMTLGLPPRPHQYDGVKSYAVYMYRKSPAIKNRVDKNLDYYEGYRNLLNGTQVD
ncbi:hypothetical protein DFJ69_0394 [Thermomonospora umbrina]|uniref:Uncharacterized protein n=1 Tax=Thermomonospora umbrina TaxID=111806 RepID=A0A3D9SM75_9ACTN|nr:hypothetical protein DFJ69_0394 [Thermomonospora umbrina]